MFLPPLQAVVTVSRRLPKVKRVLPIERARIVQMQLQNSFLDAGKPLFNKKQNIDRTTG
jgi:hypothetical protein